MSGRDVLVDIEAACLEAVRRRREEARRARAPRVRLRGSVGTAGLSALAATALTLAGEREGDRGPRRARAASHTGSALPASGSGALMIVRSLIVVEDLRMLVHAQAAT